MLGCMLMYCLYIRMCLCAYNATRWSDTHTHTHSLTRNSQHLYSFTNTHISVHTYIHICVRMCARTCIVWFGAHVSAPRLRAFRAALDLRAVGSQVFGGAFAFNQNIGAWNTASVLSLDAVCATSAGGAHRGGRARPVFDAARPLCAAPPMMMSRARLGVRVHTHLCACAHALYTFGWMSARYM